ncbi:winged helix-turn-helix domain-containing protein [Clostridiaceae bacterium M8S5]|nr:winged helix-turn-helix domain-containing protein [Clostridiaceae bacterium M8S5]
MPLDINSNTKDTIVNVGRSKIVETISAIHVLADSKHHNYAKKWLEHMHKKIVDKDYLDILVLISKLKLKGIEFIEFMLDINSLNDIESFFEEIENKDDIEFLYKLFSEAFTKQEIKNARENTDVIQNIIQEKEYQHYYNSFDIKDILDSTEFLQNNIVKLMRIVYDELDVYINGNIEIYDKAIKDVNYMLIKDPPLEVAQSIMGKKFYRVSQYKEYYFIASYFISPHNIRIFNDDKIVTIFDARRFSLDTKEKVKDIAKTMKVLSDQTRLEILRHLISNPTYGKVLASRLNLTTATISHHLELLKKEGLIVEDKVKSTKYFRADVKKIEESFGKATGYLFNEN